VNEKDLADLVSET